MFRLQHFVVLMFSEKSLGQFALILIYKVIYKNYAVGWQNVLPVNEQTHCLLDNKRSSKGMVLVKRIKVSNSECPIWRPFERIPVSSLGTAYLKPCTNLYVFVAGPKIVWHKWITVTEKPEGVTLGWLGWGRGARTVTWIADQAKYGLALIPG